MTQVWLVALLAASVCLAQAQSKNTDSPDPIVLSKSNSSIDSEVYMQHQDLNEPTSLKPTAYTPHQDLNEPTSLEPTAIAETVLITSETNATTAEVKPSSLLTETRTTESQTAPHTTAAPKSTTKEASTAGATIKVTTAKALETTAEEGTTTRGQTSEVLSNATTEASPALGPAQDTTPSENSTIVGRIGMGDETQGPPDATATATPTPTPTPTPIATPAPAATLSPAATPSPEAITTAATKTSASTGASTATPQAQKKGSWLWIGVAVLVVLSLGCCVFLGMWVNTRRKMRSETLNSSSLRKKGKGNKSKGGDAWAGPVPMKDDLAAVEIQDLDTIKAADAANKRASLTTFFAPSASEDVKAQETKTGGGGGGGEVTQPLLSPPGVAPNGIADGIPAAVVPPAPEGEVSSPPQANGHPGGSEAEGVFPPPEGSFCLTSSV